MHTLSIPDIKYHAEYASMIDELTPEQFIYFIKLAIKWEADEINPVDFKTMLLVKLLGIKYNPYQVRKKPINMHITSNIYRIAETLDSFFITEETPGGEIVKKLNLSFTKNMLPKIRLSAFCNLYGPADALTDVTFLEYMHAQAHFLEFCKTRDYAHLNRMIAVLYRPKRKFHFIYKLLPNYNGKIRTRYNQHTVEKRADKIACLPLEVRYGIYLFFEGVEEFLRTGEFEVNGNKISLNILYKQASEGDDPGLGWTGVLYSLAETSVFGNVESTSDQNLYDVMLRIYQVVKEQRQLIEKYGTNKTV